MGFRVDDPSGRLFRGLRFRVSRSRGICQQEAVTEGPASEEAVPRPIKPTERAEFPDLLRGFALFGILMANLPLMAYPIDLAYHSRQLWDGPLDLAADGLVTWVFSGSFHVCFALLFGFGFAVQFRRHPGPDGAPPAQHFRRIVVLALFGIAHVSLLWYGDILLLYAAIGLLLARWRASSDRSLLVWAAALVALPTLLWLWASSLLEDHWPGLDWDYLAQAQYQADVMLSGDFAERMSLRWREYGEAAKGLFIFHLPLALAMMLLGMFAERRGLLAGEGFRAHPLWDRWRWWLAGGLLVKGAHVLAAPLAAPPSLALALEILHWMLGGPLLALAMICGLRRWVLAGRLPWLRLALARTGRMPLTHYLAQSAIACTLLLSLGLYGSIRPAALFAFGLLLFPLQMLVGNLWLARFQQGPLEWLWRRLSYRRPRGI